MMDDDKNGKEGPGLFTEHGDEEGENSDSGGSNVEEEHVRPYEHDPSFNIQSHLWKFKDKLLELWRPAIVRHLWWALTTSLGDI